MLQAGKRAALSDQSTIRVILVDDHPVVRFGLAAILGLLPDMVVVAEAGSGEEACAVCARQAADVLLMDLRLPGMSGVEAIRTIRKLNPKLRFIVLTTYDGDEDIHQAQVVYEMDYGADRMYRLHLACAGLWDAECRRRGLKRSA